MCVHTCACDDNRKKNAKANYTGINYFSTVNAVISMTFQFLLRDFDE